MAPLRLGDDIDDYCVRCKRITNHSIVSIVNSEPAKMRCRACYSEHDYRRAEAPPPKGGARKTALFKEVLAAVDPHAAAAPPPAKAARKTRCTR